VLGTENSESFDQSGVWVCDGVARDEPGEGSRDQAGGA
jgi:hypothetical protein